MKNFIIGGFIFSVCFSTTKITLAAEYPAFKNTAICENGYVVIISSPPGGMNQVTHYYVSLDREPIAQGNNLKWKDSVSIDKRSISNVDIPTIDAYEKMQAGESVQYYTYIVEMPYSESQNSMNRSSALLVNGDNKSSIYKCKEKINGS